jgi:hypothetical protein
MALGDEESLYWSKITELKGQHAKKTAEKPSSAGKKKMNSREKIIHKHQSAVDAAQGIQLPLRSRSQSLCAAGSKAPAVSKKERATPKGKDTHAPSGLDSQLQVSIFLCSSCQACDPRL